MRSFDGAESGCQPGSRSSSTERKRFSAIDKMADKISWHVIVALRSEPAVTCGPITAELILIIFLFFFLLCILRLFLLLFFLLFLLLLLFLILLFLLLITRVL